jgi:hypothetical protein
VNYYTYRRLLVIAETLPINNNTHESINLSMCTFDWETKSMANLHYVIIGQMMALIDRAVDEQIRRKSIMKYINLKNGIQIPVN